MFDWDSVNETLAKIDLSEGLFRLEQFARLQGQEELADWAATELEGYDPDNFVVDEELPEYRRFTVSLTYWTCNNNYGIYNTYAKFRALGGTWTS